MLNKVGLNKKNYKIKLFVLFLSFALTSIAFFADFSTKFRFDASSIATNVSYNVTCTKEFVTLKFNEIFTIKDDIYRRYEFALIIPDGIQFEGDKTTFCPLIRILKNNYYLIAVAGGTLFVRKPICKLTQQNWTLLMTHDYGTFENGLSFFETHHPTTGRCYACDLLPDIFVVNLNQLQKRAKMLTKFKSLQTSGHVPFFMTMKGLSAYCPDYRLKYDSYKSKLVDYACNDLPSRWDERFPLVPKLTGVNRLVVSAATEDRATKEAWLGCLWIKSAKAADLPIHCSNFVRQFLFDVVDLFESGRIDADYRIVHGTLLGALRYNDIIPWTPDADIYPLISEENFWDFYEQIWRKLPKLSNRTYSYAGKDGEEHLDIAKLEAIRAFPMCPVVLTSRQRDEYRSIESIFNKTRNRLIGDEIVKQSAIKRTNVSKHDHWRNSGYVDVYTTSHMTKCFRDPLNTNFEWITINRRRFKTFVDAKRKIECQYGESVIQREPNVSVSFWTWFMD